VNLLVLFNASGLGNDNEIAIGLPILKFDHLVTGNGEDNVGTIWNKLRHD